LPPLQQRQDDILLLAETFAINMARQLEQEYFPGFSNHAKQQLLSYHWPGNIRELKNVVERSIYRHNNVQKALNEIILDPFSSPFRPTKELAPTQIKDLCEANSDSRDAKIFCYPLNFKSTITEYEITLIQQALIEAKFNQRKTAQLLDITYHQLRGLLKKHSIITVDK
ncbi:MAG: phage shock protein operon transcriptional activator, partial [Psychromonas sp.]|nr:phage shock protein operon transcriptional activator [Psychromonas sp.]